MEIRSGKLSEIKNFPLFDDGNEGKEIIVAVEDGKVTGYAQFTGNRIFFMESAVKGTGRALIDYLKDQNDSLVAVNCVASAVGFYQAMNFQPVVGGKLTTDYNWYEGDD